MNPCASGRPEGLAVEYRTIFQWRVRRFTMQIATSAPLTRIENVVRYLLLLALFSVSFSTALTNLFVGFGYIGFIAALLMTEYSSKDISREYEHVGQKEPSTELNKKAGAA